MKKLLALLLLFPALAFGAISGAIEWDIQGGVGSDNNGCGFKAGATGTDRSTSGATPFATLTVLSVIGASTSDIMVSTVDYTITSADVGNVVQITGGTATAGFYEIQSITTGITGTQKWTVDRAAGSAAQTVVGAMGGSCATPNKIMTEATAVVAGQTIHIKNATYTRTSTISLGASGTVAAGPITVRGYTTAHNDIVTWAGMTNAPTLTSATNSVPIITSNGKNLWQFQALHLTHTAGTRGYAFVETTAAFTASFDLIFSDGMLGMIGAAPDAFNATISRSEIKGSTGTGIFAEQLTIIDSWIHGSASYGVVSDVSIVMIRCVVDHNVTAGVLLAGPGSTGFLIIKDSVIAYNTAASTDGLSVTAAGVGRYTHISNTIFYGNTRYDYSIAAPGGSSFLYNNAFQSGTGGMNPSSTSKGTNVITITADPFVSSAANGNFALNTTAGGGAALRATGYPGGFPGGTMTGYGDVGPLQTQGAGTYGGVF